MNPLATALYSYAGVPFSPLLSTHWPPRILSLLPRKLIAQFAPLLHQIISLKPGDSRSGIGESRIPD
jgi:hypothetical protein